MKITSETIVDVGDVSPEGKLRLDAVFNYFQKLAVLHTHRAGFDINDLFHADKTWVLNRAVVKIKQLPSLEEQIKTTTWSRKIQRFKGIRDFMLSSDTTPIISATTMWIYLDTGMKKPVRVPAHIEKQYGIVEEQATDVDIEALDFIPLTEHHYTLNVATRTSDYDINGHVNNAVILQYIETALNRYFVEQTNVSELSIIFLKEISQIISTVDVHLQKINNGSLFEIAGNGAAFARGSVTFTETT